MGDSLGLVRIIKGGLMCELLPVLPLLRLVSCATAGLHLQAAATCAVHSVLKVRIQWSVSPVSLQCLLSTFVGAGGK